jgi:GT2 family glycosyltransferase
MYVLVPVFKRLPSSKRFYECLSLSGVDFKLIFSDDSEDGEHYKYFKNINNVHVLESIDLYWGGGLNNCINYFLNTFDVKSDDVVVFANNDITFDSSFVRSMISKVKLDGDHLYHPRTIDSHNKNEIASGKKLISWPFFLTAKPKFVRKQDVSVDFASGRFLMFTLNTLKKLGGISKNLPQYLGDNDFTYRAKKIGISTKITHDVFCYVDESETGLKGNNIENIRELFASFFSIKSPYSFKYRWNFMRNCCPFLLVPFAYISSYIKVIALYFANYYNIKK